MSIACFGLMGRLIGHDTKGLPITFTALDGVLCLLESAWRLCEASILPMCVLGDPGGDVGAAAGVAAGGPSVVLSAGASTSAARLLLVTAPVETDTNIRKIRAKLTVPSEVPCMLPDEMARCVV